MEKNKMIRSLIFLAVLTFLCHLASAAKHIVRHERTKRQIRPGPSYFFVQNITLGLHSTQKEYGPWGPWTESSDCSRTCGGGVAYQTRICLDVRYDGSYSCVGASKRYFSCNIQDCPEGSRDFREEQCARFNSLAFEGKYYSWVPYTKAPNPCELNCMPKGERFYFRHARKVIDGTQCTDDGSLDVCIDGVCTPVGCDMILGSNAKVDKCRECGGDGSGCKTIQGVFDLDSLQVGYNDIILIPAGATSIRIQEIKPSNNYLAARNLTGHFFLNGDWKIESPRDIRFAGTLFHYERKPPGFATPEALWALGPTIEPVFIVLLYQETNRGIGYEYSIPAGVSTAHPDTYTWIFGDYGECTQTCGGGVQVRPTTCVRTGTNDPVPEYLCNPTQRPGINRTCNTQPCPARWFVGEWTACTHPCIGGVQYRLVYCQQEIESGAVALVADSKCEEEDGPKPEFTQNCNMDVECPQWKTGSWSSCDKLCGPGNQTREVTCHKAGLSSEAINDTECESTSKPPTFQPCNLGPCEGVEWILSDWSGCDAACGPQMESREAYCANEKGKVFSEETCDSSRLPELARSCPDSPPCDAVWYTSEWNECSAKCGTGVQTRMVFCGVWEEDTVKKISEDNCAPDRKFPTLRNCTRVPCKGLWFTGPWNRCSVPCGGGQRTRKTLCFHNNKVVSHSKCDPSVRPFEKEPCNMHPCDEDEIMMVGGCKESKHGCCPDGVTVAGPNFSGCPKIELTPDETCHTTEFGCCADGITAAIGPFKKGCPVVSTCNETKYGCCPDGMTPAKGPDDEGCVEESECENSLWGCCPDGITAASGENFTGCELPEESCMDSKYGCCPDGVTSAQGENMFGCDEGFTSGDECMDTAEGCNVTEPLTTITPPSCLTSEFGCCPDNVTAASGPEFSGCEEIEGSGEPESECWNTLFGCCPDNVTASRGPDGEGCNETVVDCMNSTYGCCLDNVTIATGPDFEGCEENVTLCFNSTFGCCLDNVTSALGPDFEGCEENVTDCLNSTFGCCPDNVTVAMGPDFEGCEENVTDCLNSTFGCCPDNTTAALGPDFEGCGENITDCLNSTFGCCLDNVTVAMGPDLEGCGENVTDCFNSTYRCCPDNITVALGPDFEGCEENVTDCMNSTFGCCPDNTTAALGPSFEGCGENITDCLNSTFGCCSDNVTVAMGPDFEGCEENVTDCLNSTFGCCPDNVTVAMGPDFEGCEQNITDCMNSTFGCCPDNITVALGPDFEGCKENTTDCLNSTFGCCADNVTAALGPDFEGCKESNCTESTFGCCPDNITPALGPNLGGCQTKSDDIPECLNSLFGCCPNSIIPAQGPDDEGCCHIATFGCCPDNVTAALGPYLLGCGCQTYPHGCCPDGITPAQGPRYYGCTCENYPFGCCQDKYTPAGGPNFELCICSRMLYGCCPDGLTPALGKNGQGCSCETTQYGCCPDRKTPAPSPDYVGCPCDTLPFGCCPDGRTPARSHDTSGCPCESFRYGCCPDGRTPAHGPNYHGCPCTTAPYGCCSDGVTAAIGPNFQGCPEVVVPDIRAVGDVCGLPKERGPCHNFTVKWLFDMSYGGCTRFWYGGCEGNGNRFSTQEECEQVCVRPEGADACFLPKVEGSCDGNYPSWYYDTGSRTCESFKYSGCLGNNNRFASKEICDQTCIHQETLEPCEQPLAVGPCRETRPRFYYDKYEMRCKTFNYGGCGGNENNFENEQECVQKCASLSAREICILPKVEGSCLGNFPRWYYDYMENHCKEFTYSGCQGNKNRFISKEQCEGTCNATRVQVPVDVCSLAKDEGPCTAAVLHWYYNGDSSRCEQFYYGGCNGNANRFETRNDCERACLPVSETYICKLPKEIGNCHEFRERWYYDTNVEECRRFYYSGCEGNENNFGSFVECEKHCGKPSTTELPEEEFRIDFCFLDQDAGPCSNTELRWFYDKSDGVCKEFYYGGCRGNGNRFRTRRECETKCGNSQDVCQLPVVKGPCRGSFIQWYYDQGIDECYKFNFSGCQGNANRFNDKDSCESQCMKKAKEVGISVQPPVSDDVCSQPQEPGPCEGYYPQWYYDSSDKSCKSFIYGGCEGNSNRFETRKECESRCAKTIIKDLPSSPSSVYESNEDVCRMPVEVGSCNEVHARWFYDAESENCLPFVYGGCDGNKNRFKTYEICLRFCSGVKSLYKVDEPDREISTTEGPTCPPSNCLTLQCPFGVDEVRDINGCPTCYCSNPCEVHSCPENQMCAIEVYRTVDGESRPQPVCREINKPGNCPHMEPMLKDEPSLVISRPECQDRCRIDADCTKDKKCCFNGCAKVCMDPAIEETEEPIAPPTESATVPEEEVTAVEGSEVILRCVVRRHSASMLSWSKNGLPLSAQDSRLSLFPDGSLQIVSIQEGDAGTYACTVTHPNSTPRSRFVNLVVHKPFSIRVDAPTSEVRVGNPLYIDCIIENNRPDLAVSWDFEGVPITESDHINILANYTMVIAKTKVTDSGWYTCTVSDPSSSSMATVLITIKDSLIPDDCLDSPHFANCALIVKARYCSNAHYAKFCCRSCMLSGQIPGSRRT